MDNPELMYTYYNNVTDRVAARLVTVVLARIKTVRDATRVTANGTQVVVMRVARQVARQGLLPADLDHDQGLDVLHAVAAVVHIRPMLSTIPWTSLLPMLPDEWKHVANSAERQLTDQWNRRDRL